MTCCQSTSDYRPAYASVYSFPIMSQSGSSKDACQEKARLVQEYQKATETHSAAVRALVRMVGLGSKNRYQELSKTAETARHCANDARGLLDAHIAQHGC